MAIKKDTLHPENEPEVDIYPKTSIDQVENLQANLDALNGDIANKVGDINKDVSTLKYNDTNQDRRIQVLENTSGTTINRVEIAEKNITDLQNDVNQNIIDISDIKDDITVLNTAYESYTDYTEVTNGFLLTYLSGKQIELPIKAGTNVTFSKYPWSNQIIINSTGGSVPDNIALLDANNTFSGSNTFSKLTYFNNQIALDINPISFNDDTKNMSLVFNYNGFIKRFVDTGNVYSINIPNKTGTIALTTDIPTLADYPTTIFFNNYKAGIGYKDTSTGTIKIVVSTDNNGAQIVLGDSNTGLTLATNARPKVLEDSTVKEVAYVSDIPNTSSFPTLAGNNTWSGKNIFNNGITTGITKYADYITYRQYIFNFPNKNGTLALVEDIPISLMYSSSRLGENSVDFPFNIDKNYFFTITMTNTGESKSFIYAKGTSSTYTIVINSSTSFEVKLDATGSSTRLIFTNKSNADPFVVRAEISN